MPRLRRQHSTNSDSNQSEMENSVEFHAIEREDERDEVKEMYKFSQRETQRVRFLRRFTTISLLLSAAVVSSVVFSVLYIRETRNFEEAVRDIR